MEREKEHYYQLQASTDTCQLGIGKQAPHSILPHWPLALVSYTLVN